MAGEPQALLHFSSQIYLSHAFPEVIGHACNCRIQILCRPADKIYLIVRLDRSNVLDLLGDVRDGYILAQGVGQAEIVVVRQYIQLQADPGVRGDTQILSQGPEALLGPGRDGGFLSSPLQALSYHQCGLAVPGDIDQPLLGCAGEVAQIDGSQDDGTGQIAHILL